MSAPAIAVLVLYVLANIGYIICFIQQRPAWKHVPSFVLSAGVVVHFISLIVLSNALGRLPIVTVFEVLTSAACLFALVYLTLESIIKDKCMGMLITPVLIIFQSISLSGITTIPGALPAQLTDLYFEIHVICMMLAYSGFAIAFIASILHVLLARELHLKRLGFFFSRIPSLELLNRLNASAATLGFIFATLGMLCGAVMAFHYWGTPLPFDPKFISFFFTWCLYCFHLVARRKLGWQGERAAWLSIIGFSCVITNVLVISIFMTKLHLYV